MGIRLNGTDPGNDEMADLKHALEAVIPEFFEAIHRVQVQKRDLREQVSVLESALEEKDQALEEALAMIDALHKRLVGRP